MSRADPSEVLTRAAPPPDLTVRYGPLPEHVADVRWPRLGPADGGAQRAAPLVVVVHGGFWRAEFDRQHTGPLCEGLADAGYAVAAIEYRRTGQDGGGWPGTFEDVDAALRQVPGLVAAATPAGATPPGPVVLLGHSAGGHLVAWAATTARPGVVGAVSLAGVLDLHRASELALDPEPTAPAVHCLLGGTPDDVPDRYAATDPTRLGRPTVPVTAVHGDQDRTVPLELSRSYAEATGQRLVVVPGVEHFALIDPRSAAWATVLKHLAAASAAPRG